MFCLSHAGRLRAQAAIRKEVNKKTHFIVASRKSQVPPSPSPLSPPAAGS